VHLTLKEIPGIRTESVGVGEERQVVIHPADVAKRR
jgi:predicted RNA-binding protein Jag